MVKKTSSIVITCAKGLKPYLSAEVRSLGLPVVGEASSGVTTQGSLDDTMALNLRIRTGHRVLFLLREFEAENADDLYREMLGVSWEDYIPVGGSITVQSSVDNESVKDSRYPNLKCKDAIVDRMRGKFGSRPDSGPGRGGAGVFLYWKNLYCAVYLDTSGEPLSKRGYRAIPWKAPMQETLAAGVIQSAGWDGGRNFVNPMCGSGTLAIEAALIGTRCAPGSLRSNFAFRHLKGFDEKVWRRMRDEAAAERRENVRGRIIATDADRRAVAAARKNAAAAGVAEKIEFEVCDYSDTTVPEGGGVVLVNPEYGERMGTENDLQSLYKGLGDFFKKRCNGYTGYIFTGNSRLAKAVGLRANRRTVFFNGPIECRLLQYDLYEGSRKERREERDGEER
jgi:23S rRNA G2445 N2-methylase RlmL